MWHPVKGYEGLYEVTADGRVRSTYRRRIELRTFVKHWKGSTSHPCVNLYRDGILQRRSVRMLIRESIPA